MDVLCSRNALSDRFSRIIRLIAQGQIDTGPWITSRTRFEELIDAVPSYTPTGNRVIKPWSKSGTDSQTKHTVEQSHA